MGSRCLSCQSLFSYSIPPPAPPSPHPCSLAYLWRWRGGIQMLMRRPERRRGHGLNRHEKHAHTHKHANQYLAAELRSEKNGMGNLTNCSEGQEKKSDGERLSTSTLSIEGFMKAPLSTRPPGIAMPSCFVLAPMPPLPLKAAQYGRHSPHTTVTSGSSPA